MLQAGLVRGKTIGIDATTLEANAALRTLVRWDTGEDYETFVKGLAKSSGVPTPTREELVRFDRKRKKTTSNKEWMNPHDPDAKITKLKDGRIRLGHKVEEAVDLDTGAVLAVTAPEELGDTKTLGDTLRMAQEEVEAFGSGAQVREVVADKGYHNNETVLELKALGLRGYRSETDRGRRLQRQRSELVERTFAHQFTTDGLLRIFVRGHANVRKRLMIHVCGFNLGLPMRRLTGIGTPRSLQGGVLARLFSIFGATMGRWLGWNRLWEGFWAPIGLDSLIGAPRTHQ